jgi:hypothetical protein
VDRVNTLSAKADSFFEQPGYCRDYVQRARSRLGKQAASRDYPTECRGWGAGVVAAEF